MNLQELIQEFEARGITLNLCGQDLSTSPETLPNGIMTTIQAHKSALIRHLQAQPTATTSGNRDAAAPPIQANSKTGTNPPDTVQDLASSIRGAKKEDSADIYKKPVKTLDRLRSLLASGKLDGRHLVVLDCPHPDIGAVIRQYFGHMDNAEAERLNGSYFGNLLKEIVRALEAEAKTTRVSDLSVNGQIHEAFYDRLDALPDEGWIEASLPSEDEREHEAER